MAKPPLKYQLINPLKIRTKSDHLDFPEARSMADKKARSLCPSSRLISWFDATTGDSFPETDIGCQGKPGWLNHAESCHCDMTVDINDEQYVFVYLTKP